MTVSSMLLNWTDVLWQMGFHSQSADVRPPVKAYMQDAASPGRKDLIDFDIKP